MTVAMVEIDLWDSESFRCEQATDDHTAQILAELKEPKCRAVIAEVYSVVNGLLYF